ncbi:undecaprenyl-diphosphate phosphatase [Magnetospirillum sp. UT-4]|uniref:undecaprenyl-diphosphate phosphatase n=1 Tax=Magnetospirillum sp. UT-4 TaxID=2681467 RepID=UPI00137CC857|nr:undecaprenyl-diphosphate phosphatase [Magnetospirillum sp. UT-4]CAA7613957.1 Undecaprenyl-diphosphatase 2 [Magnetospirillum sp. UT-4]
MDLFLQALLLGLVEGLTEFLPVSSTGHLILLGDLLGFQGPPGKTFEIVIQMGAILAVCVVYWRRLTGAVLAAGTDPRARAFLRNILVGFLPAMVIGAVAYKWIRALLDSPVVVAMALVAGGIVILAIERLVRKPAVFAVEDFPLSLSLRIGLFQCLAMVPGVSRSGATIMGSLLMGVERRAAAEYSFFLAIPTMAGATAFSLYKNWAQLSFDNGAVIAAGFAAAFLAALVVVKAAIAFIGRHGFAPFAWYRIAFGTLMLALLLGR